MTDAERLEFIKCKIKYLALKAFRQNRKNPQFVDDMLWLIDKAEKKIKRKSEKDNEKLL
jgi:hypothetical protein